MTCLLSRNWAPAALLTLLVLCAFAPAQTVSLSRTSLAFGNEAVGTTSAGLNAILTNTDTKVPLDVVIAASGDYIESDNCAGIVAPSGSCTIVVKFKPQSGGTIDGVVTLADNANNSPHMITLSGTGVVPLTVSPAALTFASLGVGGTSAAQTVTVTNNLSKSVTLGVAASGDYTAAGNGGTPCGASLASKVSCTLGVKFKPTVAGTIDGSVALTQNVNSTPQIVSLTGTATGGKTPNLTFNPAALAFGNLGVGVTAKKTITVTNSSTKAITISFATSGDYSAVGGTTSPCGGSLAAGNQCTISVSFEPTATGTIHGGLTITNNGSVASIVLNLSGKGVDPVAVAPTTLTFPQQYEGATSAAKTVTVTNNLKTALAISSIAASADYSLVLLPTGKPCGTSLAAGASCKIGVAFSPIATKGTIPGVLTVASNAPSSPQVVELSGSAKGVLPRFAYVANNLDDTVSMYTVDVTTGLLRSNGYLVLGGQSGGIAVHPSDKFAYISNRPGGAISEFKINAKNGMLSVTGAPVPTGAAPGAVVADPTGKFAYCVSESGNSISAYSVNASSGALTTVAGSPFTTSSPEGITITPSGKFLYVANNSTSTVSAYSIDAGTGALTAAPGSPYSALNAPNGVIVDPTGKFVYVTSSPTDAVLGYTINAKTGALTLLSPVPVDTGQSPFNMTFDQSGKFLFVANIDSSNISAYSVNPGSGALTPVAGSPFMTGGANPFSVVVDASNQFLYATDQSDDVSIFSINSGGSLTLRQTVATRSGSAMMAMTSGTTPVTYTSRFAYAANFGGDNVSGFTVDAETGALTEVSGSPFAAGPAPFNVITDPAGKFAYVVNSYEGSGSDAGSLSAYTINASTGILTAITGSPFGTGIFPLTGAVDPSGRFLYVGGELATFFTINASTGALTAQALPGFETNLMALDPSGRFLYAAIGTSTIVTYNIDPSSGALTMASSATGPVSTESVSADPSGRFVYVVAQGATTSTVTSYAVNLSSGALSAIGSPLAAVGGEAHPAMDPLGRFLYVASQTAGGISAYAIGRSTGVLSPVAGSPFAANASGGSTVDPSGRFLYLSSGFANSGLIFAFAIDPSSGALTPAGQTIAGPGTNGIAIVPEIH